MIFNTTSRFWFLPPRWPLQRLSIPPLAVLILRPIHFTQCRCTITPDITCSLYSKVTQRNSARYKLTQRNAAQPQTPTDGSNPLLDDIVVETTSSLSILQGSGKATPGKGKSEEKKTSLSPVSRIERHRVIPADQSRLIGPFRFTRL